MRFKLSVLAGVMLPLCSAALMTGCNSNSHSSGSSDDPANQSGYFDTTNPPDINISLPATSGPVATLPVSGSADETVTAGANEAVIYYLSKTSSQAGSTSSYSLYLWNNGTCDRTDSSQLGDWTDKSNTPDGTDAIGPYWKVPLTSGETDCINFIIRDGDLNNVLGGDSRLSFSDITDRTATYVSGNTAAYDSRSDAFEALNGVANAQAHLIAGHTLVWKDAPTGASEIRLYVSLDGSIAPDADYHYNGQYIVLEPGSLTSAQKAKFPALASEAAYTINSAINMRPVVKAQLVALAVDKDGYVLAGTKVQAAGALDELFAGQADKITLGASLSESQTHFRLWAPSAQNVVLDLFDKNKQALGKLQMAYDPASGIWSVDTDKAPDGVYYRYDVSVFHPASGKVEHYPVTDPYSLSLSTNSEYSQVIDLNDADLKPAGWDSLTRPVAQNNPAKFILYESHVRDFSARDQSTPAAHQGKFLAFTDQDSVPVKHLQQLSAHGVTHIHLLPVFDIATINEKSGQVADIDEPFSKLCQVNSEVKSSVFAADCDSGLTIAEVLEREQKTDAPDNPDVQELNRLVSATDSFNWGYDPFHYTVPEGSYSTNPDGSQRILEMREMIQSIKQNIGMNVVMDVVYNHTNASGPDSDTSVLDKIVPWYYNRLNPVTGSVENSTCCSNTAPEHAMMAKLIHDSLVVWARDYKVDAFRFDLMGHHPLAQIEDALKAVQNVDPGTYFYGEGWNFGEVANDALFVQATQAHLGGTGIGSYSDRLRDAVRGGGPFDSGEGLRKNQGFGNGAYVQPNDLSTMTKAETLHLADLTRLGMAGNLKAFRFLDADDHVIRGDELDYNGQKAGYAVDPTEIQNYVSKHDNQTLWDNNQYKISYAADTETRIRMQAVSLSTAMLGQGVPFLQMGSELLRSKSMQRDSYDSGDWYNRVDFTLQDNNWNKGLPRKDKDGDNYAVITDIINNSGTNTSVSHDDMSLMVSFYEDLAKLRHSYPLLTLGSGEEILQRVDFHNTGSTQTPGLIVMSIDNDLNQTTDPDPSLDAMMVAINASPETRTVTLPAAGFALSPLYESSLAEGTQITGTTLTLPAWTPAVLIQQRASNRGAGVPVTGK